MTTTLHMPAEHSAALERLVHRCPPGTDVDLINDIRAALDHPAERRGKQVEIPNAKPWAVA